MSIPIARFSKPSYNGIIFHGSGRQGATYQVVNQGLPITDPDYEFGTEEMIKVRVLDRGRRRNVQNGDITLVRKDLMKNRI